jgi:thiamine pyrophosphate-dependent acetolactate synthase large subunit-like protein
MRTGWRASDPELNNISFLICLETIVAKSIRIHPTISMVAHQHLEAAVEAGESMSSIINRLLINQLPKPERAGVSTTKVSDLNRVLKELLKKSAPYAEKVGNGTITYAERDEWYPILEQINKTKIALGTETRDIDEIMQGHYRKEMQALQDEFDYETIRYEAGNMTENGVRIYREMEERINTLKDRLL